MEIKNFDYCANDTQVKAEARKISFQLLKEFFINELGDENVSVIGSNELAICIGTRTLMDDTIAEVCITLKPTAKDFQKRKTEKKTFSAFERIIESECFEDEQKSKAKKKAEAERQREKKKSQGKVSKSKQEKLAELNEKRQELNELAKKVKEKQIKELEEKTKKAENKE